MEKGPEGPLRNGPVGSSGLHDLQTRFTFSHRTPSTSGLSGTPLRCGHSTASAFLCHCEISFLLRCASTSNPISVAWKMVVCSGGRYRSEGWKWKYCL